MEDLWKVAIGIAGLGASGCFVFWSLYRQWLKLDIWTRMDQRSQLIVVLAFLGLTFSFALAVLGVYAFQQHDKLSQTKTSLGTIYEVRMQYLASLLRAQGERFKTIGDHEGEKLTETTTAQAIDLCKKRIAAIQQGDIVAADQYSLQLRHVLASYDFLSSSLLLARPNSASSPPIQMALLELEAARRDINTIAMEWMVRDGRI